MISMPMKGKTEEQIREERDEIIQKYLNEDEHEVVDTVFPEFTNKGNVPVKYLAKSIEAMADMDLIVFAPGWLDARGCRIEYRVAKDYGIDFINLGG